MITTKLLRTAAELGVAGAIAYITFMLVTWPFRWAMKKWKERK